MSNIADCAFAIAKEDLKKMNGAIRKAEKNEKNTHNDNVWIDISNGWAVDWEKLDTYSYDSPTYVEEYDDHITVFFGARWNFPYDLEYKLYEYGVRWQGIACEDGEDYIDDELGNSDFGLCVVEEKGECDGESFVQHYVKDASKKGE